MKVNGIIKLKTSEEEVILTTNCSKDAFIELTKMFVGEPSSYCFISSMHFDEHLTKKELNLLTTEK